MARYRPRFLLHGAIGLIGVATVSSIALQPRPTSPVSVPVVVAEVSPPLLALDTTALEATPEAEEAAPASASDTPERAAPPKPQLHTVEDGETIRMLAARYSVNPITILAANKINNPDVLQVGQELVIPPVDGVLYTLHAGDTLRKVADRFGVELKVIVDANDLGADLDIVQPGTELVIPGVEPVLDRRGRPMLVRGGGSEPEQQAAAIGGGERLPLETLDKRTAPSTRTYEVQSGDTLGSIAETFGVDIDTILSSNGIADPDTIKPGSELRILPVKGIEYEVKADETLAEIAWRYQVDLGLLLDYNDLNDPDVIHVGSKLVIAGGKLRAEAVAPPALVEVPAPRAGVAAPAVVVPAAPKPAPKPVVTAPAPVVGRGGANLVANAMKYLGYRYMFGGTSPAGFDCSGFVYYIHNASGAPVGRGMWQQYNGGAHIAMNALVPGDTVFFANTYMPGLSHDGIYIGNGQFIHASDERTGVTISSLYSGYWQAHYVGATRLWN